MTVVTLGSKSVWRFCIMPAAVARLGAAASGIFSVLNLLAGRAS